ncbi:MAG: cadmium resistance transporter [Roseibium sp.]|uniref:cadmium resistance transporter n=1 Tax=Roseibium sp. TaxID=1936156 RepID=UPI002605B1E2|nr:cadmium resistance transporter [Roseibium sp.]MCV0429743.1 cadmium resistance transporter [Roseibium sp.]
MVFALSVAFAYGLTNIDGLFAFLALSSAGKYRQVLTGFLLAHALVIGGSLLIGAGATFLSPEFLGYLGIVPIGLGVWEIWKTNRHSALDRTEAKSANSIAGTLSIFLALSTDTFVLLAAIFADSRQDMDQFALLGAFIAVIGLLVLGTFLSKRIAQNKRIGRFFERLSPFVMIAAGIYILLDTTTDVF